MNCRTHIIALLVIAFFSGCGNGTPVQEKLTAEQLLQRNIDSLKAKATKGDLVTRLNDDLISEQVKQLNEKEKLFSHAGMIIEQNDKKYICHIMPDLPGADTILITPIDSFINPAKNIKCALYRYEMSDKEKDSVQAILLNYKKQDIRFDKVYDLATDSVLYCSEMISKALAKATNGKIQCKAIKIPERLRPMLEKYFANYKNAKAIVAARTYITIDNLYLMPNCKQLMQFDLKIFPGQQ